jgi:hypothetical protein
MINCNGNCNQGRSCNCGIEQPNEDKMDKIAKYVLIFTAVYFFLHMASAFANPQYPAPIIRCIPGGGGTVTCFPI